MQFLYFYALSMGSKILAPSYDLNLTPYVI